MFRCSDELERARQERFRKEDEEKLKRQEEKRRQTGCQKPQPTKSTQKKVESDETRWAKFEMMYLNKNPRLKEQDVRL